MSPLLLPRGGKGLSKTSVEAPKPSVVVNPILEGIYFSL